VLSLPMHPFLTEADQDAVVSAIKDALVARSDATGLSAGRIPVSSLS
jgi:hypothetical protein